MTTFDEADRVEWLAWRKQGIGASDVAALVGMSPWASPMSVWTDKLGLSTDDDNDYMEFGRRAEPMLTDYFEDRTGLFVYGQQFRGAHPDHPHHRATLDGWVAESANSTDPLGIVEYKTTGRGTWGEVPDNYAIQVQWQLHVAQQDHAWMGVLHDRTFATYEVERDQRSIDMLIEVVDAFWHDHVLAEKPPPADAHRATTKALAEAYPEPVEGESVPIDDVAWAVDLRRNALASLAAAKVDQARADNYIKAAIGDAEFGTINGEKVIGYKLTSRAGYTVPTKTSRTLVKPNKADLA